jgi:hypothetical protein
METGGLIVATNRISCPNVTVAPTFSSSIPDCPFGKLRTAAWAGCAFNSVVRAITVRARSER